MADEDLSNLRIEKTEKTSRPRGRKRQYLAGGALLVIVLTVLYFAGIFTPARSVQALTVARLYPSQSITVLTASGYVTAERKAAVASKVTGRLVALHVEEGSRVKRGQIIARLESEDVEAASRQAKANRDAAQYNLEQARADEADNAIQFERNRELIKKGYIARAEYDTSEARHKKARAAVQSAEAGVKAAEAALAAANVTVEYTLIRAPFDAVVLTKNADIGDIVTPVGASATSKAAVVTIADLGSLQVEADVSESSLGLVRIGQPCEILLDALPEARFAAVVHMIVPTADRSKATIMVKIRFAEKDPRILPDMSAKVAFLNRKLAQEERIPRTAVPKTALVTRNGRDWVFTIAEEKAVSTPVTTGETLGDMLEITAGVKPGDRIVATPPAGLRSGDRVKIAEK